MGLQVGNVYLYMVGSVPGKSGIRELVWPILSQRMTALLGR